MDCIDNPNFASRFGLKCDQHEGLDCSGFAGLGLDETEVSDLLQNCPSACSVPGCTGDDANQPSSIATTITPSHRQTRTRPSSLRQLGQDGRESLDDSDLACYPGWDITCQDDAFFRSRLKAPCKDHAQFDCREMYFIGFNEQQVHDLINACPCACGIECGTWSMSPTSVPTTSPAPTTTPTRSPSFSPTSAPTVAPSPLPTMPPIPTPKTATQKVAPIVRPTTSAPTPSPSFLPTSTPTAAPSRLPTVTTTRTPTKSPTLSREPTRMAIATPTITSVKPWAEIPGIHNAIAQDNAIGQEQSNGTTRSLLIVAVGSGLMVLLIVILGVVLRKNRSSLRQKEHDDEDGDEEDTFHYNAKSCDRLNHGMATQKEYDEEDGDEEYTFHDNAKSRDRLHGMATQGEPYISPNGVIYTRREVESSSTRSPNISITDQTAGVEVRRISTASQDSITTTSEEARSIHEPIARIAMKSGLSKFKAQKNKQKRFSHEETESHFDRTVNSRGLVTVKSLGRGRSPSSRPVQKQAKNKSLGTRHALQAQHRERSRSRSFDGRNPTPRAQQEEDFETLEQRIAERMQRSRDRRQQPSVPQIESMSPRDIGEDLHVGHVPHEAGGAPRQNDLQINIDRPRSHSGMSRGGRFPQSTPRQSSAEENPFTFVRDGDADAADRSQAVFESEQIEHNIPPEHAQESPFSFVGGAAATMTDNLEFAKHRAGEVVARIRAEQATAAAAVANRSQAVFESIGSPTFAERNPFTFFGDDTAAKRSQAEVQSKQNEHVPTMAPPPPVVENPPVPTTITGRTRTRSNSNGRSRKAMVVAVPDDDDEEESIVVRTSFFSDLIDSFNDEDLEDEDTDYTDISAISSRSIRSRIWEQMKQDEMARQAAGMGLPMMRPIHE